MSRDDRNAGRTPRDPNHGRARGATEAGPPKSRWPLPRLILLIGGVLLAAGLGVAAWRDAQRPAGDNAIVSTGTAAVGGPFRLVDQDGRPADESLLRGHWTAMFFGYTYCPDVCPATLSALKVVKDRLGDRGRDLRVVFVSIDPERDTPAQIKSYLSSPAFPQPLVGLTGTPEQVAAMARAYKVYYARNGAGADYLMDHASAVYLMDPQGRFHSLISTGDGLDGMASRIGDAIGES